MTTNKQFKKDVRELADTEGISYTAARRRLTTETAEVPQDRAAMLAGLVARSRGKFTTEEFTARLERGGQEYTGYLADGREAAIEAFEYALEHGVDAVDDELGTVAARKGMPITTDDLAEALRQVRDHSLLIDGSSVAETAYWVADRFWMHRWNDALDRAGIGEYDTVVGPNVYRRFALHEWMAPGHSSGSVPGLY
ncbi:hypothetical protein STHAL_32920 [Streptomyces halstedii]|uniref:Uncharacterized protein n=1 Tax=Streptomyces halstedii TaxID=1944 RepID=A0ABS6U152_STRHA|nr:hypothetical protein [Streptomyces halstedii]MBV7674250.1 hypothetical protein [Streptomyces halstedii]